MLKTVLLNGKKLPVPVPVKNVDEALSWLEEYLVGPRKTITRIELDGVIVDDHHMSQTLSDSSRLVVQADSAIELAIQTIDALRNLVGVMLRDIKHCAVQVYKMQADEDQSFLNDFLSDLVLILELAEHLFGLVGGHIEPGDLLAALELVNNSRVQVEEARKQLNLPVVARLILQFLEPQIQDVSNRLVAFQKQVLELDSPR